MCFQTRWDLRSVRTLEDTDPELQEKTKLYELKNFRALSGMSWKFVKFSGWGFGLVKLVRVCAGGLRWLISCWYFEDRMCCEVFWCEVFSCSVWSADLITIARGNQNSRVRWDSDGAGVFRRSWGRWPPARNWRGADVAGRWRPEIFLRGQAGS